MLSYLLTITEESKKEDIIHIFNSFHDDMILIARSFLKKAGVKNYGIDAEDAVQNAFVKITKYINTLKDSVPQEHLRTYLYAVVVNEAKNIIEENNKESNIPLSVCSEMGDDDFINALMIKERYDTVVKKIKELDERYSGVMLFRYCSDMSVKEIAKLLGVSTATVYTRLNRGKQKLLEDLSEKEEK